MQENKFEHNIRSKVKDFTPDTNIPDFGLIKDSIPVFEDVVTPYEIAEKSSDANSSTVRKLFMYPMWALAVAMIAIFFALGYFLNNKVKIEPNVNSEIAFSENPNEKPSMIKGEVINQDNMLYHVSRKRNIETIKVNITKENEYSKEVIKENIIQETFIDSLSEAIVLIPMEKGNNITLSSNKEASNTLSIKEAKSPKTSNISFGFLASNNLNNNIHHGGSGVTPFIRFDNEQEQEYSLSSYEAFSRFSHKQPLRVGLSIGYYISKRVMIETGIIYSFLESDFTLNSGIGEKGKQKLQYWGVPLFINYDILKYQNLRIYVGIGGEVNFNLSASQKYSINDIVVRHNKRDNRSIGAYRIKAGVSYKIIKNTEIYTEPSFAKFFSDTELNTIWTDNKYNFDLNLGLRLKF